MEEIKTLQQINVLGDTTLTGQVNVTNNVNSTSFDTGSIVLSGGVGVAKDVFVNGSSYATNISFMDATGTSVATQNFDGTTWRIGNQSGNALTMTQGATTLNHSTSSTSTTTGALTVVGGISTEGNVLSKGKIVAIDASYSTIIGRSEDSLSRGLFFSAKNGIMNDNSGNFFVGAEKGIKIDTDISANKVFDFVSNSLTIDKNGTVNVNANTESDSTVSGALQVSGGLSVRKNMNLDGTLTLWDGANSGTIGETSLNLNVTSSKIELSGNVQVNGNVQITGNVTFAGETVTASAPATGSATASMVESNVLDDCILHAHIYNLANPSTPKTMLTSSYPLKDYSNNTGIALSQNVLYFYATRLVQGQSVNGVFFWSNSTSTNVRTGLYDANGNLKLSLDTNQGITGNTIKYLPITNTSWTVNTTGIYYVAILSMSAGNTLYGTPTNTYANYGQAPVTGKLSLTSCQIGLQTSMPATISGLTPTALSQLAYVGVYKDGV